MAPKSTARKPMLAILAFLVLSQLLTSCFTTESKAGSDADSWSESLAAAPAADDAIAEELELNAELITKSGAVTKIPLIVDADRNSVHFQVADREQRLRWDGEDANCNCRSYENDNYTAFVWFDEDVTDRAINESPEAANADDRNKDRDGARARASIANLAAAEALHRRGHLNEEGVDVTVQVTVVPSREYLTFDYQGETQTLQWDEQWQACHCRVYVNAVFTALLRWPEAADQEKKSAQGPHDGPQVTIHRRQ